MVTSGRGSGSSKQDVVSSKPEVPEILMGSDTLSEETDFDRKWPRKWEVVSSKQQVVSSELKVVSSEPEVVSSEPEAL